MNERITVDTIIDLLSEFCEHDGDIKPQTELLDSGILDSLGFIELLNALEDMGCPVQPTEFPRERFSTPLEIAGICNCPNVKTNS